MHTAYSCPHVDDILNFSLDSQAYSEKFLICCFLLQVRKRPLNKKEVARKEDDIVTVSDNSLTVHEPKLKVCPFPSHTALFLEFSDLDRKF